MIFFRPIHFIVCIVGTAYLVHGLSISPSSAELGVFPSWERRSVTFIVKNHSKKPVSLLRVRSSCSCAITNFVPCTLDPAKRNDGLPEYSNTPHTAYYRKDRKERTTQIRFYRGRYAKYDVDWGHAHKGCPSGVPHIHEWKVVKDMTGKRKSGVSLVRQEPRTLNSREWIVLKPILRQAGFKGDYKK